MGTTNKAAIYLNGGNRWNTLGFNFTKRNALSIVYIRYLWYTLADEFALLVDKVYLHLSMKLSKICKYFWLLVGQFCYCTFTAKESQGIWHWFTLPLYFLWWNEIFFEYKFLNCILTSKGFLTAPLSAILWLISDHGTQLWWKTGRVN